MVLKGVNFTQNPLFPLNDLEISHFMLLKACLALTLADLLILYGARGEVSANKAESPGVSPLSMFWSLSLFCLAWYKYQCLANISFVY